MEYNDNQLILPPIAQPPLIWLVIPCYNEEDALPRTASLFIDYINQLKDKGTVSPESIICFVDDGSSDTTWQIISQLSSEQSCVSGVRLSRNCGHQNALLAGLMEARGQCDAAISMDCDGQDDIAAVERMVLDYQSGHDVVYGVRSSRKKDTLFKRFTAESYYKALSAMGAETVFNHADYRLLSTRALDAMAQFKEVNLYLRGIVPLVGFNSSTVEYNREERVAGESHYPLKKMILLALDGITSFSVSPLRIVSIFGGAFCVLGIIGALWAVVSFFAGMTVDGWASTVVLLCVIGGIQMLSLGIIGEYIGKIYMETKSRPRYIISERV